jgi:glycosyltransferase involved in cell wall biosynthesis
VVGDGAQTFDPLDARGMADAVAALLSNPEQRQSWRARALKRASQFSWAKAAEETAAVYRKVYGSVRDESPSLSFTRRHKTPAAEG